jgi:hypothetical protein
LPSGQIDEEHIRRASSGAGGRFEMRAMAPGRYQLLVRPSPGTGLAPALVRDVTVEEGKPLDVEHILTIGATVSVRVADSSGQPVAGARVWITPDGSPWDRLRWIDCGADTDGTGTATIRGLARGPYRISVMGAGGSAETAMALEGSERKTLDVTLR